MRGRALVPLLALLALGCTTRYIKFPAEEYLISWHQERLRIQDETAPARKKCAVVHAALLAPGTGVPIVSPTPANIDRVKAKCDELATRLAALEQRDLATMRAALEGDTIDKEQIEMIRSLLGPLLDLAKLIVAL